MASADVLHSPESEAIGKSRGLQAASVYWVGINETGRNNRENHCVMDFKWAGCLIDISTNMVLAALQKCSKEICPQ